MKRGLCIFGLTCVFGLTLLRAADLHGTIVVKHRLTKRRVTPVTDVYDRGIVVKLDADQPLDPLAYERTHVVIYLDEPLPSKPVVSVIEQRDRRFMPDLVVVPVGSSVAFPNFDPIFHNIFSLSKPKSFDLGNYSRGQTRLVTFPTAGTVQVNCHLHSNMSATILITPSDRIARPDAEGNFILKGIPTGRHTIVAWHKAGGTFKQVVDVTPAGNADLRFLIPIDESGVALR